LATRLRESGLFVMGVGEKKTPDAFVQGLRPVHLRGEPGCTRGTAQHRKKRSSARQATGDKLSDNT
jgi:hypothetical protein